MAMVFENLDQKTFVADSPEDIDKIVNTFKKTNVIRFTQANICFNPNTSKMMYMATVFYLPGDGKQQFSAPKSETTVPPAMSGAILDKPVPTTPAATLSRLPKKVIPESEAQWTNCGICNMRWKWTHFRLCPQRHGIDGLPTELKDKYMEIWSDGNGNKTVDTPNQRI